jgi:hypothetical protein
MSCFQAASTIKLLIASVPCSSFNPSSMTRSITLLPEQVICPVSLTLAPCFRRSLTTSAFWLRTIACEVKFHRSLAPSPAGCFPLSNPRLERMHVIPWLSFQSGHPRGACMMLKHRLRIRGPVYRLILPDEQALKRLYPISSTNWYPF